ncbi:MAG: response regulator transcription factor [Patescibacteria group bacterium]|nr:response regulator transcription factor [Patescibacteria group bacterium]MDD5715317.1 response regulator transcription factor [Patescibacteria group bacterium]
MNILIVEDEAPIREVMRKYLEQAGFHVEEAGSGEVAILKFNRSVDLVVLDLNLPHRDGLEVCKHIRAKSQVPVIIVTARTEELDELKGLQIGADDYIRKPFSPKVLVARVQSMLRRASTPPVTPGGLAIDEEAMVAYKNGERIILTTTQFKILQTLIERPNKVFMRQELIEALYPDGSASAPNGRTIDAHIKAIRKLIGDDPHNPRYIKTVIGTGYKYDNEIS